MSEQTEVKADLSTPGERELHVERAPGFGVWMTRLT